MHRKPSKQTFRVHPREAHGASRGALSWSLEPGETLGRESAAHPAFFPRSQAPAGERPFPPRSPLA